jgi:TM2 domain-containing membrane protein YozV
MSRLKKEKDIAGLLALFFGFIGLHRFYLGQRGRGILYLMLALTGISAILGLIDAFSFFSMDNKSFDIKYNRDFLRVLPKKEFEKSVKNKTEERNTFVKSGKLKFLSYDYDGAIVDFSKALELNPREIAAHFNIACAYSLNENVEKALFHLDKAILYGFDDFEKLKNHDALAFIRVQPAYINFVKNGFSFSLNEAKDLNTKNTENIEKLEELRLRGLLTEEEFTIQKMKISRL